MKNKIEKNISVRLMNFREFNNPCSCHYYSYEDEVIRAMRITIQAIYKNMTQSRQTMS
jgi:hypothetical protein